MNELNEKVLLYRIYSQDPQAETSTLLRGDMTQKKSDLLHEESKKKHSKHSRKEEQPEIILDHYKQKERNQTLSNKILGCFYSNAI